jgi:hypothetical protein
MTRAIAAATTHAPAKKSAAEATGARPGNGLRFRIGKITLQGYGAGEQKRFAASLQENLSTMARQHRGLNWRAMAEVKVSRLDAGELPSGASPEQAAHFVARKLFSALQRAGRSAHA